MIREAIGRVKTTVKIITKSELDAMDLLRADHMKLEAMLMQLRFIKDEDHRSQLFKRIRADLTKHMKVEEQVFYPMACQISDAEDLVEHAYEEHAHIRQHLKKLATIKPSSTRFSKAVTEMIKTIEDHVMEEEDKIFPMVKSELDELSLRRLDRDVLTAFGPSKPVRRAAA